MSKKLLIPILFLAVLAQMPARASVITWTFQNGTFDDGTSLTGTFTFDTATSAVTTWDIDVLASPTDPPGFQTFTYASSGPVAFIDAGNTVVEFTGSSSFLDLVFTSGFDTPGIITLDSTQSREGIGDFSRYVSGTATSDTSVPEPDTMLLAGLAGLALATRYRAIKRG